MESPQEEQPKKEALKNEEKFVVPNGGECLNWVEITPAGMFDPNTGERMAIPFVQAFDKADYELLKQNYKALGYTINVLHEAK